MGNGALPHGPSYRAHPRLYQSGGNISCRFWSAIGTIADVRRVIERGGAGQVRPLIYPVLRPAPLARRTPSAAGRLATHSEIARLAGVDRQLVRHWAMGGGDQRDQGARGSKVRLSIDLTDSRLAGSDNMARLFVISFLKGKSRMIDHALTYPSCRAGF
jgi:hypothetical protein